MTSNSDVSIIIRAYNEAAHIGKLMRGIAAQRVLPREVILVDSGSTDDTVAIAKAHGARVVHLAKQEFTFGRALNLGCEAATGEILVFASAHVYPVHDAWLEILTAPFSDPRVAVSYGGQRGGISNKYSEHRIFERWFPLERAVPQKGYFCNNANCAVRRSTWEQLRYDETLTGLEDLDFAKRAQASGAWVAYEPDALIIHVHEEKWSQVRNRYRREAMAMRLIDPEASFSFNNFVHLFFASLVSDYTAAMKEGVMRSEWLSILRFRFNHFWGTWQGYNGPSEVSHELRRRFYYPGAPLHKGATLDTNRGEQIDYSAMGAETYGVND